MEMNLILEVANKLKETSSLGMRSDECNFFKLIKVDEKEVIMCRFLADLISPNGNHNCGRCHVDSFARSVLKIDTIEETIFHVTTEYKISEDRRIDIVLENDNLFIPIEVKINAGDEKSQVYDYYQFALQKTKERRKEYCKKYQLEDDSDKYAKDKVLIYYLTKDGKYPSEISRSKWIKDLRYEDISKDKIKQVSFREVRKWIVDFVLSNPKIKGRYRSIVEQYVESIDDFIDYTTLKESEQVKEILCGKKEYLQAAVAISHSLKEVATESARSLLKELESKIELEFPKLADKKVKQTSYMYHKNMTSLMNGNKSTRPGINYIIAKLGENVELWLRIEINYRLFAGFYLYAPNPDGTMKVLNDDIKNEITKYLKIASYEYGCEDNFVYWRYLPTGDVNANDKVPNYGDINDTMIELNDKESRTKFIEDCINKIQTEFLDKIMV